MEFTFISGTILNPTPIKVDDYTYVVSVSYQNIKATVQMPLRLHGSIAEHYLGYLKKHKDIKTIYIAIIGNIFITKDSNIYIEVFRIADIQNADGLYEGMVHEARRGMVNRTLRKKKGEKKYARKKTINTNNGTQ